jgi:UDP-N-acetylglucosamine 4-epimerase
VTKLANELYAEVFSRCYGFNSVGLRYFNVFGPRQDPDGPYAAVIPRWTAAMLRGQQVSIYGDGESTRDFCYVANAARANLLAALATGEASGQIYNVATGGRTSLAALFSKLKATLGQHQIRYTKDPVHGDFRAGDIRHSQADISKAVRLLGYAPTHSLDEGLAEAMPWYLDFFRDRPVS